MLINVYTIEKGKPIIIDMINIKLIYVEFVFSSKYIPILKRINAVHVVNFFFWDHFLFLIAF